MVEEVIFPNQGCGYASVLRVSDTRLFAGGSSHVALAYTDSCVSLSVRAQVISIVLRNMKGVVAVRVLRQVQLLRKVWPIFDGNYTPAIVDNNSNSLHGKSDDDTDSMTEGYDDDFSFEDEYEDYQTTTTTTTMMMMKTTPVRTAKVVMLVTVMSTEKMASPKTIVGSWWMMASRIRNRTVRHCASGAALLQLKRRTKNAATKTPTTSLSRYGEP
jgi:hypothetical protein